MNEELAKILEDIRLLCSCEDSGAFIRDYISLLTGKKESWQYPNREHLDAMIERERRDEAIRAARIARLKYATAAEDLKHGFLVVFADDAHTQVRSIQYRELPMKHIGTIWQGGKKGETVSYYEPVEGDE